MLSVALPAEPPARQQPGRSWPPLLLAVQAQSAEPPNSVQLQRSGVCVTWASNRLCSVRHYWQWCAVGPDSFLLVLLSQDTKRLTGSVLSNDV